MVISLSLLNTGITQSFFKCSTFTSLVFASMKGNLLFIITPTPEAPLVTSAFGIEIKLFDSEQFSFKIKG